MKAVLVAIVPAETLGPGVAFLGKHLGQALEVGELKDVEIRFHVSAPQEKLLATFEKPGTEVVHNLKNGPNAVPIKSYFFDPSSFRD